jgi:hypothetical protein
MLFSFPMMRSISQNTRNIFMGMVPVRKIQVKTTLLGPVAVPGQASLLLDSSLL